MDALSSAKSYATLHHVIRKGQLYGDLPYTHHLAAVEGVLREFDKFFFAMSPEHRRFDGYDPEPVLVAAWLHDIVEDTDVKIGHIEEKFGEDVAMLVEAVTNDVTLPRPVRNAQAYPRIRAAGPLAVRLKLADRIANVRNGGSMVKKYAKEHTDFRHALFSEDDGLNWRMWNELDYLLGFEK